MHILYIHQHFAVPSGATGTRSYEFARRWARAGHSVSVISGYYDLGGLDRKPGLDDGREIEGIRLCMVGLRYSNKQSYLGRILSFVAFFFCSIIAGLRIPKYDMIYASSTPLSVGIPAIMLAALRRIPFVFEVRDQWPEIPIALGVLKNRLVKKFFLWLEKRIYKSSSGIVALSPGMAEGVEQVLQGDRKQIIVVPNGCDLEPFSAGEDDETIRRRQGWETKFVCMHAGAMGRINGLDFLIDAAIRTRDYADLHFVLIGDGSEKDRLKQRVQEHRLTNIEIFGPISKSRISTYFRAIDVSLVIITNCPILQHNSANKFFDSLSAGKPIVLNYSGWQRNLLEQWKAGYGIPLYDLDAFVEKIVWLYSHREQAKEMGDNSRKLGESCFSRDELSHRVLIFLETIAQQTTPG